ncbi:unnamed protein product [Prunus armeniaca]
MQRNYKVLEAVVDRVLALPHTPEVGSSNQASPSGSVGIAMASTLERVDIRVGVPLARRNILTKMMLAKLRYALGQYNPNFWLLSHGVYIAWWLAGLGEPTFEQFMYLYSISKQQGSFGWVQANCRKVKEMGYFISHKPSTQKSWRNRLCLTYGDWECPPGKTVSKHIPTHFQFIGLVKWGPIFKEQEDKVDRVRSLLSETERKCKNLVTQKNLLESGLLQGSIIKGSMKVAVDLDDAEMQKRLKESRAQMAGKGLPGKRLGSVIEMMMKHGCRCAGKEESAG